MFRKRVVEEKDILERKIGDLLRRCVERAAEIGRIAKKVLLYPPAAAMVVGKVAVEKGAEAVEFGRKKASEVIDRIVTAKNRLVDTLIKSYQETRRRIEFWYEENRKELEMEQLAKELEEIHAKKIEAWKMLYEYSKRIEELRSKIKELNERKKTIEEMLEKLRS
ncbi:MAG: hypothetical protein QXD89_02955 [Candidatus Aenigmatarchaeota archaeon]